MNKYLGKFFSDMDMFDFVIPLLVILFGLLLALVSYLFICQKFLALTLIVAVIVMIIIIIIVIDVKSR